MVVNHLEGRVEDVKLLFIEYRSCECNVEFYTPSDVDVADGTLLCDDPVLVCEEWIQLLVQAVVLMGQSVTCQRGKKDLRRLSG